MTTMRSAVDRSEGSGVYRAADLLTNRREEELNGLLERDDELREKLVELCDPKTGEVR